MSISIEVIDSATGRSAVGSSFRLWRKGAEWDELANGKVGETETVPALPTAPEAEPPGQPLKRGMYRLRLELDTYFAGLGVTPFQSQVEVVFRVFDSEQRIRFLTMITPSSCETHIVLIDK